MSDEKAQPANEELKQHGDALQDIVGSPEEARTVRADDEGAKPGARREQTEPLK